MIFHAGPASLITGDCLDILRKFADNRFDAIVTDPPYGLSFMGKAWDYDVPKAEVWAECLRVLKPGGHLLAFFGSRTYHRGVCQIEDGGFEIRDSLQWIYGTGFPKSLNVGKAIDAAAGATREVVGERETNKGDSGTQTYAALGAFKQSKVVPVTAPATEAAKQWEGWGTALKPAHEPIVLARKPLTGTVAANVQAHGTGALNIDGCRVGTEVRTNAPASSLGANGVLNHGREWKQQNSVAHEVTGRWPANVILDEEAARLLDEQSGELKSGARTPKGSGRNSSVVDMSRMKDLGSCEASEGGASRFFYTAKASRKERDEGCEALPPKTGGEATDREDGSIGTENPRAGAGRTGGAKRELLEVEIECQEQVRKVVLRVDTATSPPKVTGASGAPEIDASAWSMILFGSKQTAPSLRGATFITGTRTSSTIESKIWNWLRGSYTNAFTEAARLTLTGSGSNPVPGVTPFYLSASITDEKTASLLGVKPVPSPVLLRISGYGALESDGVRNTHPTVKPVALMRWLCRLITPPGGTVLDPFAGSGSTGVAALMEGFEFIGVERDPEYCQIAAARLNNQITDSKVP